MTRGPMPTTEACPPELQTLAQDEFLYYFLRLRKQRVRAVVSSLQVRFPAESPEQLAERLIDSHSSLSFLGGSLFHVPALLPGASQLWTVLGLAGGASVLTRMHVYLILEIALLYGRDIDDRERVPEIAAVVAATGAAVAGPAVLTSGLELNPLLAIPAAGLAATAVTRLIGKAAIARFAGAPGSPPAESLAVREPREAGAGCVALEPG